MTVPPSCMTCMQCCIPIDPGFAKKLSKHGHDVSGEVEPPEKLGIHGANVAVDHEESDTSKKSSPKPLLQFVRISNICHAVTGEAGTILRVMTGRYSRRHVKAAYLNER